MSAVEPGSPGAKKSAGLGRGLFGAKAEAMSALPRLRKALGELKELRARIAQLELDVQESRQFNKRLAELTDAVAEVLLPAEQRDETRLRELLASYDKGI